MMKRPMRGSIRIVLALLLLVLPRVVEEAGAQEAVRQVTLEEALSLAERNNPALEQSASSVEIAGYQELTAWGQFLPNLSLSYQYSDASSGRLDPTGQAITTTSYSAQLRGSVDLFRGFRRFTDLKGARLGVEASEARYRETEFTTSEGVKISYFNAVANRDLVAVERDRVQRQEDQLSFVQQQLELGRATRSDVLRSQVDLNNAKVALLTAENSARNSRYALAEAVGMTEPLEPVETEGLSAEPLPYDGNEILSMALSGAPSLVSARSQAAADEAAVASAKSSYLPTLTFGGGWAWSNIEYPPQSRSWSLSLSGSMPLFNGFSRESQLYTARARADQSRSAERAAELKLRKDVDQAMGTIDAAVASIDLAQQTEELAAEDLRVTQERYRLGLATILDLQSAQITLLQAQVDVIRRRFDYQLGLARLEALLGTDLR
ncbi:MAG: TolC family protein [Candidatus Palauibacterales bacterium]|nr:TolC family protein [Candidatus Palauibacterales bacterium]